jgi:hypothetical protein
VAFTVVAVLTLPLFSSVFHARMTSDMLDFLLEEELEITMSDEDNIMHGYRYKLTKITGRILN